MEWWQTDEFNTPLRREVADHVAVFYGTDEVGIEFAQMLAAFLAVQENAAAVSLTSPVTRGEMVEALQDAWNDYTADTGCFPEVFTVTRGPRITARFGVGNFAGMVADWVNGNRRRKVLG